MSFDYSKLLGKIVEVFGSQAEFAKQMNSSERSISLKLNNKRPWKQEEIVKAMGLLGEDQKNIQIYFFTPKVQ